MNKRAVTAGGRMEGQKDGRARREEGGRDMGGEKSGPENKSDKRPTAKHYEAQSPLIPSTRTARPLQHLFFCSFDTTPSLRISPYWLVHSPPHSLTLYISTVSLNRNTPLPLKKPSMRSGSPPFAAVPPGALHAAASASWLR